MAPEFHNTLFIFRRDLRLDDNNGLISALERSEKVIPIFILDDNLLSVKSRNEHSIQFMQESLNDLILQLKKKNATLFLFKGQPKNILHSLLSNDTYAINCIIVNRDYTPYSVQRDKEIAKLCNDFDIEFLQVADSLLNEPEIIHTKNGTPYTVFTPFFKRASQLEIARPQKNNFTHYYTNQINGSVPLDVLNNLVPRLNSNLFVRGGRKYAQEILSNAEIYQDYDKERDFPAIQNGTTQLSAHLKFGNVSIREVYHTFKDIKNDSLVRQLYWRDFYTHIGFHFPHVFHQAFRTKYNGIEWFTDNETKVKFQKWCEGRTGFPIVDAGMRQLNQTGYMHNRVRMIVASFLTKDLHVDWRWGEQYFAQKLIDLDKSVNNGNWQWAASTGCDAVPYFRIFNPWRQQKKFDPQCLYIKEYIPELRSLKPKDIHNLHEKKPKNLDDYPEPIVIHSEARKIAINLFKFIEG